MRRITREALEPWMPGLKPGFAIVIFPAASLISMSLESRKSALESSLRRAGMLE